MNIYVVNVKKDGSEKWNEFDSNTNLEQLESNLYDKFVDGDVWGKYTDDRVVELPIMDRIEWILQEAGAQEAATFEIETVDYDEYKKR